jgi:hypothetical protein
MATAEEFAERLVSLRETRARLPELVRNRFASRHRRSFLGHSGRLLLIEVTGLAAGSMAAGEDSQALRGRGELLRRLVNALRESDVDGVIAPADVLDDLLLLEVLDDHLAIGSLRPGGLAYPPTELDRRFTGFDVTTIAASHLDGGRLAIRIDPSDPASAVDLEACADAVTGLAGNSVVALLEPTWAGPPRTPADVPTALDAQVRAVAVASAVGARSSYTWLALPASPDLAEVVAGTTLPVLVHAGDSPDGWDRELWAQNLAVPGVRGMVVTSSLLYESDDDDGGLLGDVARLVRGGPAAPD